MSLKALVEKRNALLDEAKMILDKVETEVRALTTEEDSEYELKIKEVEQINATIKKLEERAVEETTEEVVDSPVEEEVSSEPNTVKRHRRTKAEMEEARSLTEKQAKIRNRK